MSDQDQMTIARWRLQKALQTFPTNRTLQSKDKDLYEAVLLQVRAVLAAKRDPTEELALHVDIGHLEDVVGIKTEYVAFLDAHMAAFEAGLDTGAGQIEGGKMHWEAAALIKYVDDDEKEYLKAVRGFDRKWKAAIKAVNPDWVKTFGPGPPTGEDQLGVEKEEEKVEEEEEERKKPTTGRLKGKARKEAKKALMGKK